MVRVRVCTSVQLWAMTAGAPPPQFPYTASDLDLDIHPAPRRSTLNSAWSPRASTTASGASPPRSARASSSQPTFVSPDEDELIDEKDLCCPLLGPWKPFWGDMSLYDVGSSDVLSIHALMAWRAALAALAVAALVLVIVFDVSSLRATQLVAILFALYCALRQLYVSFLFRRATVRDANDNSVFERNRRHARFGLIYQCTLSFLLFSPLGLLFALMSKYNKVDVFNKLYAGKIQVIVPVALLIIAFVIDVWFSKIEFRLTYVIPIVLYALIFVLLTMYSYGITNRGRYTWMSVGTLIAICILTLFYGRIPLVLRRGRRRRRDAEIRPVHFPENVSVENGIPQYF